MRLLIIDDEASIRRTLRVTLESMGHDVADAASGEAAQRQLGERFDLAFLDVRLGRESGLDLLPSLLVAQPGLAVVIVTAYSSVDIAVEAMRRGAFDYLPKPFTPGQLRVVLDRCRLVRGLQEQVADLRKQVEVEGLDSEDPSFRAVAEVALKVAPTEATVLLRGENGTGKGVIARAIHARSKRSSGPFVTVHCPSLSAELLESDLFGHVRGAFTGAVADKPGKVAGAEGGTLFLDEIGDLPLALQPKLLRFLQEKAYERVGETKTRTGDVRLVAATNQDLEAMVASGRFREDLLYRLNVIELKLPSLRERPRDIVPLARRLLAQLSSGRLSFSSEAEEALGRHSWPGNLRELRNAVERAAILSSGPRVEPSDLPMPSRARVEVGGPVTLKQLDTEHIRLVMERSATLEEAAATLGINPSTLYRHRKR